MKAVLLCLTTISPCEVTIYIWKVLMFWLYGLWTLHLNGHFGGDWGATYHLMVSVTLCYWCLILRCLQFWIMSLRWWMWWILLFLKPTKWEVQAYGQWVLVRSELLDTGCGYLRCWKYGTWKLKSVVLKKKDKIKCWCKWKLYYQYRNWNCFNCLQYIKGLLHCILTQNTQSKFMCGVW